MALRWHPDRCKPEEKESAEEKFKEVSAAYETLSNPDRKAFYDRWGDEGVRAQNGREPSREDVRTGPSGMRGPGGFGGAEFQDPFDIFAQFFGADVPYNDGPYNAPDMGIGRDVFGRSVFHGPGGVRVVVGGNTSPTSILMQMLIGGVEQWASRRRRQAQDAAKQDETSSREDAVPLESRRTSLMVPCTLEDLLTGCSKEVTGYTPQAPTHPEPP
jgi:DnaJ-class molecular chaperone